MSALELPVSMESKKVTVAELRAAVDGDEVLDVIEDAGAHGCTLDTLAALLGISKRSIQNVRTENEAVDAAYRRGRARQFLALSGALFRRAVDPNDKSGAASAMFLLKTVHGLREQGPTHDDARSVNVNILNLPAGLSTAQYNELREARPDAVAALDADAADADSEMPPGGKK